jgi:hypothetical protein
VDVTVVTGAGDPLYIEAGFLCPADGAAAAALVCLVVVWNRTDTLIAHCRLLAETTPHL